MHDRPARPTAFCWNQKYPRVCGEKAAECIDTGVKLGSPPRMRGKASPASYRSGLSRDHPRVCGEKLIALISTPSVVGSPPRMRGKASGVPPCSCSPGITPAYAGKRARGIQPQQGKQDHPRVCGEKMAADPAVSQTVGSPPRMRGKVADLLDKWDVSRITPAYAGKRNGISCPALSVRDHPRICGEKYNFFVTYPAT